MEPLASTVIERRGCRIIHTAAGPYLSSSDVLDRLHVPQESLRGLRRVKHTKTQEWLYHYEDIKRVLNDLQHPHVYDLHQEMKMKYRTDKPVKKHELALLAKIVKNVGYVGS